MSGPTINFWIGSPKANIKSLEGPLSDQIRCDAVTVTSVTYSSVLSPPPGLQLDRRQTHRQTAIMTREYYVIPGGATQLSRFIGGNQREVDRQKAQKKAAANKSKPKESASSLAKRKEG
jgi:hypothetical protein